MNLYDYGPQPVRKNNLCNLWIDHTCRPDQSPIPLARSNIYPAWSTQSKWRRAMQELGWGVIGCGEIANMFAGSLKSLNRGQLVAGA
jgi:hypothetical protein